MVKHVFKLIFDFEQAEAWLNKMASQGWVMALRELMAFAFLLMSDQTNRKTVIRQVLDWDDQLPNWIKALWPVSLCES